MKTPLPPVLSDSVRAALGHLSKAFAYSRDMGLDAWQFAIQLACLARLGVEESDLRWLVLNGFAARGEEIPTSRDEDRRFRRGRKAAFTSKTCFVLTEAGVIVVQDGQQAAKPAPPAPSPISAVLPHWDAELRVLFF